MDSEFVVSEWFRGHAESGEHLGAGFDHHRRTADVVFNRLGIYMGF
jgi:hypothetical protein